MSYRNRLNPICIGCNRIPSEIEEYIECGQAENMTPDQYVLQEEGTLNPENGHFLCTECYIKAGQPTAPWPGWRAP